MTKVHARVRSDTGHRVIDPLGDCQAAENVLGIARTLDSLETNLSDDNNGQRIRQTYPRECAFSCTRMRHEARNIESAIQRDVIIDHWSKARCVFDTRRDIISE